MLGERCTASACIAFAEIQIFCRRVFYFGQGALRGSNLGDQGHLAIRQEDSLSLVAPGLSPRFVSRDGLAGTLEMKRADFRLKIKSHTVFDFRRVPGVSHRTAVNVTAALHHGRKPQCWVKDRDCGLAPLCNTAGPGDDVLAFRGTVPGKTRWHCSLSSCCLSKYRGLCEVPSLE